MKGINKLRFGASTIAAAILLAGAPSYAQSASAGSNTGDENSDKASSGQLDEIVVTARFREERLQDTPLAITAVSGDDLADRSVGNVQDMGRLVPNAFITPGAAAVGATPTVSLRGVFQADFNFAFDLAFACAASLPRRFNLA